MLALYMALVETEGGQVLFETIYNDYRKRMFYIANQVLHNNELSEDAVQEALLGIAKTVDKLHFENQHEINAYVYTVVKHAAYNIKKNEVKKAETFESYQTYTSSFYEDAYNSVSQKEMLTQVISLLSTMPPHYKDVLFYSTVYDMNSADIGILLGRPAATIRKQLARARELLKDLCEKEGIRFAED